MPEYERTTVSSPLLRLYKPVFALPKMILRIGSNPYQTTELFTFNFKTIADSEFKKKSYFI